MTLIEKNGDLFESDALKVHAVNCKGVWGRGIALEFKRRFPELYEEYKELCQSGILRPGMGTLIGDIDEFKGPVIGILATQDGYGGRQPARLEWVRQSLKDLYIGLLFDNIKRISMPKIGCGLGGLKWEDVKPIIEEELNGIEVEVWSLE